VSDRSSGEPGIDDDVVTVAAGLAVEFAAAGDQSQLGAPSSSACTLIERLVDGVEALLLAGGAR
jgi:hypothetical protein